MTHAFPGPKHPQRRCHAPDLVKEQELYRDEDEYECVVDSCDDNARDCELLQSGTDAVIRLSQRATVQVE